MSAIKTLTASWEFNRSRTLAILDKIEDVGNTQDVLGWRPGQGRAHIAWQMMHIAVTEELFATERLTTDQKADFPELVERFRGGSTPDDEIPSAKEIRDTLSHSREHLLKTLATYSDDDLETIPTEFLEGRGWTLKTTLHVLGWHEGHHQGQAHLTLNLYNANQ